MAAKTKLVPVSDPAHPSHPAWLEIMLAALRAATVIGPAVIDIVDQDDSALAHKVGDLAGKVENSIPSAVA